MTWNYRLMTYDDGEVGLHEVFYNRYDGSVQGWTGRPCGFAGESAWSVRKQMLRALWDTFRNPPLPYIEDPEPRYTVTDAGKAVLRGES